MYTVRPESSAAHVTSEWERGVAERPGLAAAGADVEALLQRVEAALAHPDAARPKSPSSRAVI